jgi:hypothetical protein
MGFEFPRAIRHLPARPGWKAYFWKGLYRKRGEIVKRGAFDPKIEIFCQSPADMLGRSCRTNMETRNLKPETRNFLSPLGSGSVDEPIEKITSGGQTGVDRAALDVALELGIPCGGWCPKGRRAEDGRIPERYPLEEASSKEYPVRTRLNVEDSDGTLVLTAGNPTGGTALTLKLARQLHKPFLLVDLARDASPSVLRAWLQENHILILNVAGPREGESSGIYGQASAFLRKAFTQGLPG